MDYNNKHILVLGFGTSGIGAAKVLARCGATVTLNDLKEIYVEDSLQEELDALHIKVITGRQDSSLLEHVDRVITSPGIPLTIPIIVEAKNRNIEVTGEVELAYDIAKAPILGITGTNGKTTSTMLLAEVMKETGKPICVGGNIGDALSQKVLDVPTDGFIIAELSSYQLESIINFKTHGAIVLNLTPDHLQRHKTMKAYQEAKEKIFLHQDTTDITVLNYDDAVVKEMATRVPGQVLFISQTTKVKNGAYFSNQMCYVVANGQEMPVIAQKDIKIPGAHNIENILAVIALSYSLGVTIEQIKRAILRFSGVEHRIEPVRTIDGVRYFNDSKATNTDSAIKALEAFTEPIVLIAGGYDKMTDLSAFMNVVKRKVKSLILIGDAAERFKIAAEVAEVKRILTAKSMREAVKIAQDESKSGEVVLLSPACSSFDWYTCFEERGEDFKENVKALH